MIVLYSQEARNVHTHMYTGAVELGSIGEDEQFFDRALTKLVQRIVPESVCA